MISYDRLIAAPPTSTITRPSTTSRSASCRRQPSAGPRLKEGKGPFNIELFGGSPDDNNAFYFYNGAMSVLQP